MARRFRLWEKKRGDRRTGSRLVGGVGEAAFFGSLFLLGSIALATLLTSQALAPNPEFFRVGFGTWLALLVLASLILIGGAGFLYTVMLIGVSAERRSALARRAGTMDLGRQGRARPPVFPTIPRDANLTNSPGVKLAYRLPCLGSPAWKLVTAAVTALLCVGIATTLIALAAAGLYTGHSQWALTAFLVPFSSVTAWCVYYFVRELLVHTAIGPTSVEISEHPLYPGQTYEAYLVQGGQLKVKRLAMTLICEEEATYRQGTDLRTERFVVHCDGIFAQEDFRIQAAQPFEHAGRFVIPSDAMHTFQSPHNAVQWKLVVCGDFARWPTMIRSYPVIVHPPPVEEPRRGTTD